MNHPRFARLAAVAGLLLASAVASAESLDEARTAFAEGRFVDAAGIAEAAGTSEGYALAARSLAVYGHYAAPEEEKKELFERALQLGEEAVRADTANPEGYFQSGHALGRYAQSIGTMTALRKGLGGKTRKMFEATLARDPDHALAHLALGGWNADIVSRAGRMMARVMYGATKKEAAAHFERALELAPESKVVLLDYALRLPKLAGRKGRERARELLEKAVALPVGDVYGGFVHERAVAALKALAGGIGPAITRECRGHGPGPAAGTTSPWPDSWPMRQRACSPAAAAVPTPRTAWASPG